jgi:hypothetical protein
MKQLLALLLFTASIFGQTMILTPSYITTLKARATANSAEWQLLRNTAQLGCDALVQYTANTPDHLPGIASGGENATDGYNSIIRIGTDGNAYQGTAAEVAGMPAAVCYLTLKDGDVTPSGWSYTWNGVSLTPQQYGILAGIQAVKILNKTTPSFAKLTPATPPGNWGGLTWRIVGGVGFARYNRYGGWANSPTTFGSVDAYVQNATTSASTAAGDNVLHFTSTSDFTGTPIFANGEVVIGTNIPAGTTVSSFVPNTSVTLSANVTGAGVASGALITTTAAGNNCSAAGQAPVFVGFVINPPAAHSAVVLSGLLGPLSSLNGNTYYVSTVGNNPPYGFDLDTTAGGGTLVCAAPMQGTDYKGNPVGSGENYNHNPQNDNEYPDRFFLSGMGLLYDWLHPLLAQTPAAAINQLAALEPSTVTSQFSGYPWSQTTYPQAIPTNYATLQAQVLDSMDAWTRDQLAGYYSGNDVGSFVQINNYHWGHYSGLALAAIAACHGSAGCASPDDPRASVWYDYWRNHLHLNVSQPYTSRWYGANGNMMDSWNYLPTSVEVVALALVSNITAMGDDLVANASQPFSWITGLEYYKHNLEPNGKSMLTRGYMYQSGTPPCPNCAGAQQLMPIQYLADLESAPLANQFRSFMGGIISAGGESGDNPSIPFLFWNPSGTQTAWAGEPTTLGNMTNPAGGYGHVYMRSDWTSGAVYGSFEARPYVFDWGNTKDTLDTSGSILLQRGSNTLLIHPQAECDRAGPVNQQGAGSGLYSATSACYNAFNYYTLAYGGGYYWIDTTVGNPPTSGSADSLALTTSAPTSSGATLTFASTTGVTTGMLAIGTNVPATAFVIGVTSTTVILNQSVSGTVASGATITFASAYSTGFNVWSGASGGTQGGNAHFWQPGYEQHNPPVCTGPGTPYAPGPTYTVSGQVVTVTPSVPLTSGWGNGTVVEFSWATGATPPTYYLTGSSGPTTSVQRGTAYNVVNWNSAGTFGVILAPTNIGSVGSYPTSGTALTFATPGSGTNIIHGGKCSTGYVQGVVESNPARVDLLESTANYTYARGVGLEANYGGDPAIVGGGGGHVIANQREVLYLLPKLFLVYDRTRQSHWNQQAVSFTSIIDSDGTNPVALVTAGQTFHSGMQVKLTSVAGTGCSSLNNQTYTITALDANRFALNGATSALGVTACTGTATGNIWGHQIMPWRTGAKPVEVTTAGQVTAGMRQWHVKAPAVNIASISNTTPVTIITSTPHQLNTGFAISVAGVTGVCSGLNGVWTVTVTNTNNASNLTTLTLNGSTASGACGAVGTIQKFNGAITTILPKTPSAALSDMTMLLNSANNPGTTAGAGYVYQLAIHDPRNCTSNPTWCQAAGADAADSQNWLTALDASQSASDTATLTPLTSTNADMVQVGTGAVAGFQNAPVAAGNCANSTCTPPVPVLPISYTFTYQSGSTAHTLAGMLPSTAYKVDTSTLGSVAITASGSGSTVTSTANGVLAFNSSGSNSPSISSLSPSSATAGGAQFTLTVNGASFDSSCAVTWNSTGLATTYVGTTQCTAVVPNTLIATPGTASVTITTTSGGTSAATNFIVTAPFAPFTIGGKITLGGRQTH